MEGGNSERCSSCIATSHFQGLEAELPSRVDLKSLLEHSTVDVSAVAEGSLRLDSKEAVQISNNSGTATVFIESAPGELLPAVQKGDCVLLRNFVVHGIKGELCLLSQRGSYWCLIRRGCSERIATGSAEYLRKWEKTETSETINSTQ
jgi:hypothetical protein